jgi:hypothetical protein
MSFTATVTIGGVHQDKGSLGAFVGTEARGVQSSPKFPPFGAHANKAFYMLTVHGNGHEMLTFQFHRGDAAGGNVTMLDRTAEFIADGVEGNVYKPFPLKDGNKKKGFSLKSLMG